MSKRKPKAGDTVVITAKLRKPTRDEIDIDEAFDDYPYYAVPMSRNDTFAIILDPEQLIPMENGVWAVTWPERGGTKTKTKGRKDHVK